MRLSYEVDRDSPGWPGNPTMEHRYTTHTSRGDPDTHSLITIFSHFGSHIDAPSHHIDSGLGICDLGLDYYIYERPLIIDIPKGELERIEASDLVPFKTEMEGRDVLLIRTGWSSVRAEDSSRYAERGPCVGSEAASYIMNHCPELKALGIDSISIGSPLVIEESIASHEILAGRHGGRGIVLIEDIDLRVEADQVWRVFALPLFMKGLEGSPCTVVAEIG